MNLYKHLNIGGGGGGCSCHPPGSYTPAPSDSLPAAAQFVVHCMGVGRCFDLGGATSFYHLGPRVTLMDRHYLNTATFVPWFDSRRCTVKVY